MLSYTFMLLALILFLSDYLNATNISHGRSNAISADSWFADVIITKMSYYRALCNANPLTWNDTDAYLASIDTSNCSLDYDTWSPEGQIIFRIGRQDNEDVDIVNNTYFAIDHWYSLRQNYRPTSNDWDKFEPFYASWEFTQMVWKANTVVGCAWQDSECAVQSTNDVGPDPAQPLLRWKQLLCYLSPGGNKWDQFGLEVDCPDCNAPTQTSAVSVGPHTVAAVRQYGKATSAAGLQTPFNKTYWDAELDRIEEARNLFPEDFYLNSTGIKDYLQAMKRSVNP